MNHISNKKTMIMFPILFITFFSVMGVIADTREDFKKAILSKHNFYRSIAGITTLEWDDGLQMLAENWVNKLQSTNNCKMSHSPTSYRQNSNGFSYIGENLFYYYSSQPFNLTGELAERSVQSWYEEIADFQYSPKGVVCPLRGKKGAIGHFTQVMWDSTKSVGCGYALCNGNKILVISCNYGPGGNFNQSTTPPFPPEAAEKLNLDVINKPFGGLPKCN